MIVSKSLGYYLATKKLPVHHYGQTHFSILDDEYFLQFIQLHLQGITKDGYIRAQDIVDFVMTPEVQKKLEEASAKKKSISTLGWQYGCKSNGMYIDGHERDDVKEYRKQLSHQWLHEYEPRMIVFDNNGKVIRLPKGFPLPAKYCGQAFELIFVTHDESTFYANDRHRAKYHHISKKACPEPKEEDFQTVKWRRLVDGKDDAHVIFKAGTNHDGWFTSEDLLAQVDHAIDIFEGKTNGFAMGLWMFDNTPNYQKCARDALFAQKLPKRPSETWTPHSSESRMCNTWFANGEPQHLYYPDDHPTMPGWFKGMETIIREQGLWPEDGLLAQCEARQTDCCCRWLLFTQPDFIAQKSQLKELIVSWGHICDFYPKYHCDYANHSAHFISAYYYGLTGVDAVWAARKYAGHRILPPDILADIKEFVKK
ncbi:hypothetical protein ARMGADRAFT_1044557 [Armillaria gallica]|uniref:Uncharacterized protein n=1 Tax=Armillaria gallica TaxID=47427 RepID=A0A2H3EEQ4_ARMGA|nr:hypothetical protein ARMGADRAFT_1044557 [Armillaria gallica]